MKILIGSPTSTGIGGIARHVQGLDGFLRTRGHAVEIISAANTFTIPIPKLRNPSFMLSAYLKCAFKKNFDIVNAQGPPAAFAMKNATGKKVLSLHGIHHRQVKLLHGSLAGFMAKRYEKFALDWADVITVPSREIADYCRGMGYDVRLVPLGIDAEKLPHTPDRRYEKQIIYAARLSKEKGILDVLELSKRLPDDIHLLILGDGPEQNRVKMASSQRVHYLGSKSRDETVSLIRGSDILLQPSLMEGGISYTLLESLACKTPLVCTSAGGGQEFFDHLENCYLVKSGDIDDMLDGITRLFEDPELYAKLSKSGYNSIQKFSWNNIGSEYLKIYRELLK